MKIVILGGGTVGWLAAHYFRKRHPLDDVTVIESSKLGVVGGAESITKDVLTFLNYLNIEPIDLIKRSGGTFKTSAHFKNWNGDNTSYYDVLSPWLPQLSPSSYTECSHIPDVDAKVYCQLSEDKFPLHLFGATNLLTKDLAPLYAENEIVSEVSKYTFNIDGIKFPQYLSGLRKQRNISIVDNIVKYFEKDSNNNITAIVFENEEKLSADIVIDCSGLSQVTAKEYGIKWVSHKQYLPVDSTALIFLELKHSIPSFVDLVALKYGWLSKIPLQDAFISGYNFSSQHTDLNSAGAEIRQELGQEIRFLKSITYESGYYEKCWYNNCISIGGAASFIEPLVTSNISSAINLLRKINLRKFLRGDLSQRDIVNSEHLKISEVNLNNAYFRYMTKRNDTDFWKSFCLDNAPASLQKILDEFFADKNFIKFCSNLQQSPLTCISIFDGLKIPEYDSALRNFRDESRDINTIRLTNKIQSEAQKLVNTMVSQRNFFDRDIKYVSPEFNTTISRNYVN